MRRSFCHDQLPALPKPRLDVSTQHYVVYFSEQTHPLR